MPIATIPLTSFTGGEWSNRLHGRVDIGKYQNACEKLQNMILYPHGGITRRMGMEYIGDAKVSAATGELIRLIPFEHSREQAYVLEFGHNYIRFWRNGGQVLSAGVPLEIATTIAASDLENLTYAQSADVLYLACDSNAPLKLSRTGPDAFTLATVTFTGAPAAWTSENPASVTFFQNRLVFGGTKSSPQTIWMSKVGLYEDFTKGGASDGLEFTLSSNQVASIRWMIPGTKLLIGSTGGEFSLYMPENSATNIQVKRESNFGSKNGKIQLIGNGVIYASRDGKKLREMAYSYESDGFVSPELSLLSEHITRPGIKEFDFAQNPDGILWTVINDGSFAGLTYLKSQEVQGWHTHTTQGIVCSVCTIEGDAHTETWFAVTRNGRVLIERMAAPFEGSSANSIQCAYLDSYLTYSGAAVTTLSGLSHLEGLTVSVLGDGQWLTNKTVASGSITLEKSCSKIVVGLPYEWRMIPLRLEGGSPLGFAQGKKKSIHSIVVRLENSSGINHRIPNSTTSFEVSARSFGDNFDEAIELYNGDIELKLSPNWSTEGQFELHGSAPFPVTILMISAKVVIHE